ncbi:putative Retrotransposable element SLACS 132 kDa protein [Hypsibius exemplaris]|uniref:Retrotransposable element SLACS 132 kDa protein n=1 Tax=Hypsibius exemplaris TaxID=2072580 RepID=A0A9X6NI27_HYPEX|nr:putative Retrotransposable element SLACS 132 kDa protein [Hypsibius exemplaris]
MVDPSGGWPRTCESCGRTGFQPSGWALHRKGPTGRAGVCIKDEVSNKYGIRPSDVAPPVPAATHTAPNTANDGDLSTQLQRLRQANRLFDHVPKAARHAAAESLTKVLADTCSTNDNSRWGKLLTFPYLAFSKPDKSEKVSLATIVKRNLGREGNFLAMSRRSNTSKAKGLDAKLRTAVEKKIQAAAPADTDFPPDPGVNNPGVDDLVANEIKPGEVREAVRSFPNGSSGGLDELFPQHMKDLLAGANGEIAERLSEQVAALLNIMLRGKVPLEVCPLLYGATLTALKKKDGGIRPIAVGTVWRRILGKIVAKRVMSQMALLMRPCQLGCGTRGGVEAAAHATRAFMSETGETRVLLKLDFANAFNTVRRDAVLRAVQLRMPYLYPTVWQMYRHLSHLFFGDFLLSSESGVQQGDPLGPMLFCLVTRTLSMSLQSPLKTFYLDDGTVGGSVEEVLEDFERVAALGAEVGLELNPSKCDEVFVYGGDQTSRDAATASIRQFIPKLLSPTPEELELLGAPLLTTASTQLLKRNRQPSPYSPTGYLCCQLTKHSSS